VKILTADQIRELDRATVEREGIDTVALMERAAEALAGWVASNIAAEAPLLFLVGKGNNGGDGLAMARILFHAGFDCTVLLAFAREELGPDMAYNLRRLPAGVGVTQWQGGAEVFVELSPQTVIVDALLGTGLRGGVDGPLAGLIKAVNNLPNTKISIDLPSGMAAEPALEPASVEEGAIIDADTTLTIGFPKLAMLLPEAGDHCGRIEVVDIGLDREFIDCAPTPYFYFTAADAAALLLPERKFAHKGSNGSALLVCGSAGMAGAAVLAAGGALRSGCGLVKVHLPGSERMAVQANYPSALVSADVGEWFSQLPPLEGCNAIGVGPGLGTAEATVKAFGELLAKAEGRPMVIDADALNIIAANPALGRKIPRGSILTPHPGELRRLVGEWDSEERKIAVASELAALLGSVVVVKGAHTMVCLPDGRIYFNSTGNSGMAKGGSGDVLTGLLTGLLARGYSAASAALLGVWLHGAAGDKAAEYHTPQAMNSADIIDFIGEAFAELNVKC